MFQHADLVLLTKFDLAPHLDMNIDALIGSLARVMPHPSMMPVSARTGDGIAAWIAWLEARLP